MCIFAQKQMQHKYVCDICSYKSGGSHGGWCVNQRRCSPQLNWDDLCNTGSEEKHVLTGLPSRWIYSQREHTGSCVLSSFREHEGGKGVNLTWGGTNQHLLGRGNPRCALWLNLLERWGKPQLLLTRAFPADVSQTVLQAQAQAHAPLSRAKQKYTGVLILKLDAKHLNTNQTVRISLVLSKQLQTFNILQWK